MGSFQVFSCTFVNSWLCATSLANLGGHLRRNKLNLESFSVFLNLEIVGEAKTFAEDETSSTNSITGRSIWTFIVNFENLF